MKPGLLRFLLASIVIIYHITSFVHIGTLAVYCFFILSGYWITFMYEKKYSQTDKPVFYFYISRILRLFPVYYLFTLLALLVIYIYLPDHIANLQPSFWVSNIFLIGYNFLHAKPIVPAWSLDIELQFYIIYPIIILTVNKRLYRTFYLIATSLLTVILTFIFPYTVISETLAFYLMYFIIGICLYKDRISFSPKTEQIFTLLFLIIFAIHYCIPQLITLIETPDYNRYFNQFAPLLLIPFISKSVLTKSDSKDRLLGDTSYVLYLSHWVWFIPYTYYVQGLGTAGRFSLAALFLLITYGMTYTVYMYFDKPVDEIRRRWIEKKIVRKQV